MANDNSDSNHRFPTTLVESVLRKAEAIPDRIAFQTEQGDGYSAYTHREFLQDISATCHFLEAQGVDKGARIGILARPCYAWEVADKATLGVGAITVGLDHKASTEDLCYVIKQAGLTGAFVENTALLDLLPQAIQAHLGFIVLMETEGEEASAQLSSLPAILARYAEQPLFTPRCQPDDIAVIIFTSGTTGNPKGIPLTHRQLTKTLPYTYDIFKNALGEHHRTLAWIPLYNGTGRMMGTINYFMEINQYFVKDPLTLFDRIKAIQPTYLVVVPRILEKVYGKIQDSLNSKSWLTRLFINTLFRLRMGYPSPRLRKRLGQRLADKIKAAVWGDSIEFLISGSAPVDANILRFFDAMGLPTYEVYGLSEIGVLVCMNRPGQSRYGSVGLPMPGMDVKLAPDQEILVKTDVSLPHYWSETDSSDIYDAQGYLKTGDLGEFNQGFLFIIGRKKELFKTSTGQRIAPVQIEQVYQDVPGVEHFMVVGAGQKYLAALITIDPAFEATTAKDAAQMHDYLAAEIAKRAGKLAANRQVKRFAILPEPLTVEAGEITPTLKLRRTFIENKYRQTIHSIYERDES